MLTIVATLAIGYTLGFIGHGLYVKLERDGGSDEGTPSASHNTGSPKCACPWVKPCDFCGDGGACNYSAPNQTGALRAGA